MTRATLQADMDEATRAQVYRWAYRVLRNHHDALDATQDVLIKWLRRGHAGIDGREAWLRTVTVNHCIDLIRRRKAPDSAPREQVSTLTPAGKVGLEELRDLVADGLSQLSDRQRAVVIAKVYDKETFASIADSMGLSESSVKTHYVRGLRAMRSVLKCYGEA